MAVPGDPPMVAVGKVSEGVTAPLVPLESLFEARLATLANEHAARIDALVQLQARSDALVATQAATVSQTMAASAAVLEKRVSESAAATAGAVETTRAAAANAVEQTRVAFERSIDRTAEAALTNVLAVRREMELRDTHQRELTSQRLSLEIQLQAAELGAIRDRIELGRVSHQDEHTRIREIGALADAVRASKDAGQNEWRNTVETALARQVTSEVLQAKLDAILQRIELSDRTTQDRSERSERTTQERLDISMNEATRRLTALEKTQNENGGGRTALLAAAALMISIAGILTGIILFVVLHH